MATTGSSSRSPRSASSRRNAPATAASTTSLTVPPKTRRTVRISSRGTWENANRRCGEMAPLSDVRGARNGAGGGTRSSSSRSRRLRSARSCTAPRVRRSTPAARSGWRTSDDDGRADQLGVGGDGLGPPRTRVDGATARGTGPESRNDATTSTPDAPSNRAWWTFGTTATCPDSSPSTTCISHSGLFWSRGRPARSATNAASSAGPTRGGKAGPAQVVVDLEVGVLHPHGVVQPEGHAHHASAQGGDEMDALVHDGPQPVEVARRHVVPDLGDEGSKHHDRPDVHVHGVGLERQEGGVHPAEALHHRRARRRSPTCPSRPRSSTGVAEATEPASRTRAARPRPPPRTSASSTAWMTSWAMRSPRWTS